VRPSPGGAALPVDLEVVSFDEAALAVDLRTGSYYRLNATAEMICRVAAEGGDEQQARVLLVETHRICEQEAAAAVTAVWAALRDPRPPADPVGPLRYRPSERGYALHLGGSPMIETSRDGSVIRLVAGSSIAPEMLEQWVRCIAPKALFLQGVPVLHASACSFGASVLAFSGESGAGKTTTALAFAATGRVVHSEDLVVVDVAGNKPIIFIEAEATVRAWAAEQGKALAREPGRVLDCRPLASAVCRGGRAPLGAIWFVDRARREGVTLRAQEIPAVDTLAALLQTSFLGSSEREAWRAFVRFNSDLARVLKGALLWVPDGVPQLREAAARLAYSASSTS
jgi:hypothetical protein